MNEPMERSQVKELMMDYLYRELDAPERAAFEAALARYPDCAAEVESLERTRQAAAALPPARPPARVRSQLLDEAARHGPKAAKPTQADAKGGLGAWWARVMAPLMAHPGMAAVASLVLIGGIAGWLTVTGAVSTESEAPPQAASEAAPESAFGEASPAGAPLPEAGDVEAPGDVLGDLKANAEEERVMGGRGAERKKTARDQAPEPIRKGRVAPPGKLEGADARKERAPAGPRGKFADPPPAPEAKARPPAPSRARSRASGSLAPEATGTPAPAAGPAPRSARTADVAASAEDDAAQESAFADQGSEAEAEAEAGPATPSEKQHAAIRRAADRGECAQARKLLNGLRRRDPDYVRDRVDLARTLGSCAEPAKKR